MKKSIFLERYPIYSLELLKSEIEQKSIDEVVEYFIQKIQEHKVAKFIALFDHYSHTKNLGGEINPEILDAKNVIFCVGAAIPTPKVLAVRPRSIGICEFEDKFVIDFLEAPNESTSLAMQDWAKALKVF